MFNPSPPSQVSRQELAKALGFLPAQEAFHSSNLTSRFFFISVSFSRIARCHPSISPLRNPSLADSLISISNLSPFVNPLFPTFLNLYFPAHFLSLLGAEMSVWRKTG